MKETYSRTKSVWQRMDETERKAVMDYGEKYKAFLDTARTERLARNHPSGRSKRLQTCL